MGWDDQLEALASYDLMLLCKKANSMVHLINLDVSVHQVVKLIINELFFFKKNNYFLSLTTIIIKFYLPKASTK